MGIKKKIIGIILLIAVLIGMSVLASEEDPVVSLSYLIDTFKPSVLRTVTFTVLDIKAGERFYGCEGCEFILRGGKGIVKASSLGGLNNATNGTDLEEGSYLPPNHLIIVPRDDGRGFVAETDVIIMVKGNYYFGK